MPANDVTDAQFQTEVLENDKYVLVDFWAEWCGPCRMMKPVVDAMADKYTDTVAIFKMDTDANPDTAQKYQIAGIPCCIGFKGGEEVGRIVGYRAEDAFEEELNTIVGA